MDENGIVIRDRKDSYLLFIALVGLVIGVVIFGIFFRNKGVNEVLQGVLIVAVLIVLLVYLIKRWREQVVEIGYFTKGRLS